MARYGNLSFSEVLEPAIRLAEDGFPIYEGLHDSLAASFDRFNERYPTTAEVYYPDGRLPEIGEVWRNPGFADALKTMCAAEREAKGRGRIAGYRGCPRRLLQGADRRTHRRVHHDQPGRRRQRVGPHRSAVLR